MKKAILLYFVALLATGQIHAKTVKMTSPDKHLTLIVSDNGNQLCYSLQRDNDLLLNNCQIGLTIKGVQSNTKITATRSRSHHDIVTAPFYRQAQFTDHYNELRVSLGKQLAVEFRLYNEGIAYRFTSSINKEIVIEGETADFNFAHNGRSWMAYSTKMDNPFAMAFQNIYTEKALSEQDSALAFLPVTIDCGAAKITLAESDLEAYPGMFVSANGTQLKGVFAPYPKEMTYHKWRHMSFVKSAEPFIAKTHGTRSFPWRVIAVTTDDAQLPCNNLVYALASPNRIGETSWIKPGKVAWDWWNDWGLKNVPFKAGINTETYKYYIDFAAQNGLQYIILDEGWYNSTAGDIMNPIAEINLPELIAYGHERGVGIVLWAVFNVLDEHLEEACAQYANMGIKGFKVDFMDRDDQTAVEMAYRIAETCARHHLVLDYHGFYKPTGFNRTFPNILNVESVFGMEEMKWNKNKKDMPRYDVTFPFIRMMAGPVDYTPGAMRNATKADYQPIYYNPMSMGTRCHQLACYIVHDSPFTMLCDAPTNYRGEEACVNFIAKVPDVPDETRILQGEIGESIVTARRKGPNWWIGGLTNWTARDISINLTFLDAGARYIATIFSDGPNAEKNASDYTVNTCTLTADSVLQIHLTSGGGFAISLQRDYSTTQRPTPPPANKNIDKFYSKYQDADGLYVVASSNVADSALTKTAEIIRMMLAKRPDIRDHMVKKGCYTMILGQNEQVMDLPEYAFMRTSPDSIAYWNKRARGFGGAPQGTFTASFGEENVLALPTDRYNGESIMVHEFAHIIHTIGICGVEPDFDKRLETSMQHARERGLWSDTYALSDKYEYFAESVQDFFDCNRRALPADGVHNSINSRAKLQMYDPEMYALLTEYFYEVSLPLYNKVEK